VGLHTLPADRSTPDDLTSPQPMQKIVPLDAARVENLVHANMVRVLCTCGHRGTISVHAIKALLPGYEPITAIRKVMRCRRCNTKGDVEVDCRAALGYGQEATSLPHRGQET
jgi:hypothetical protein